MNKVIILFLPLTLFILIEASNNEEHQWTWLFTKKFSSQELVTNKNRTLLMFSKMNIPEFNQLIFSWNAFKPIQGYFSFYAQVRDAKTKKWHEWHKMVDWGGTIAQSYCTKGTKTEYKHVRLEVPHNQTTDGLRIKIIPLNAADLSCIHALGVNISNSAHFKSPTQVPHLPSVCITNIPQQSQMILPHPRAEHMCSPTSCSMLVSYLNKKPIDSLRFAHNVYDQGLDSFGSWPFNTSYAYEQCGGSIYFHVARLNSFSDLHAKLKQSIPVVVSVRGALEGAPREYKNGHLILVIGWDQQTEKVICHDPAFDTNQQVTTRYSFDAFSKAWGRSHNLAYLAEKKA